MSGEGCRGGEPASCEGISFSSVATSAGASSSKPPIVIGSTNFEEQAIVSNIWADVLKKHGYQVTVEPSLGTRAIVVPAIEVTAPQFVPGMPKVVRVVAHWPSDVESLLKLPNQTMLIQPR